MGGFAAVGNGSYYLLSCVDALEGANPDTFRVLQHVIWEDQVALGTNALRIWLALHTYGPLGASSLARTLGLHRSTVHDRLGALRQQGLVSEADGAWKALSRALDAVAEEMGLAERKARRHDVYERSKENYHRWVASRSAPTVDRRREAIPFTQDCPLFARVPSSGSHQVVPYPRKRLRAIQGPITFDPPGAALVSSGQRGSPSKVSPLSEARSDRADASASARVA